MIDPLIVPPELEHLYRLAPNARLPVPIGFLGDPARTRGVARDMQAGLYDLATPQGGGNLNGSSNTAHRMGQAGTGCDQHSLPRSLKFSGNYCGVV